MRDWHPIETAPKDRWVLVWSSDSGVDVSYWRAPPYSPGWYGGLDGYGDPQLLAGVTHWMLLPDPPPMFEPGGFRAAGEVGLRDGEVAVVLAPGRKLDG